MAGATLILRTPTAGHRPFELPNFYAGSSGASHWPMSSNTASAANRSTDPDFPLACRPLVRHRRQRHQPIRVLHPWQRATGQRRLHRSCHRDGPDASARRHRICGGCDTPLCSQRRGQCRKDRCDQLLQERRLIASGGLTLHKVRDPNYRNGSTTRAAKPKACHRVTSSPDTR